MKRKNKKSELSPELAAENKEIKRQNRREFVVDAIAVAAILGVVAYGFTKFSEGNNKSNQEIAAVQNALKSGGTEIIGEQLVEDKDALGQTIHVGEWSTVATVPLTANGHDTAIYKFDKYGMATTELPETFVRYTAGSDFNPYSGMAGDALGAAVYVANEQQPFAVEDDHTLQVFKLPFLADTLEDLKNNNLIIAVDKPDLGIEARLVTYGDENDVLGLEVKAPVDHKGVSLTVYVSEKS